MRCDRAWPRPRWTLASEGPGRDSGPKPRCERGLACPAASSWPRGTSRHSCWRHVLSNARRPGGSSECVEAGRAPGHGSARRARWLRSAVLSPLNSSGSPRLPPAPGPGPPGAAPESRRPEPGQVGARIRAGIRLSVQREGRRAGRASEPPACSRAFSGPERPRGQAAAWEGRSLLLWPRPAPRRGDRSDRQRTLPSLPSAQSPGWVQQRLQVGTRGHVSAGRWGWRGVLGRGRAGVR